jgi:tRNA pseudouridine55 synthase
VTQAPASPGPRDARAPYAGPGGFLLLDKPVGISSFQALRPVKRAFPKAKVGHAGTLDPAASGLLIAGVGAGTRLLEYLEGQPKTYAFTALFGFVSDTCDLEGRVEPCAGARPAATLTAEEVERALAAFRGVIRQVPPAYSAIKIGGERAYALARAGEAVALEAREVEILSLELESFRSGGRTPGESTPAAHGAIEPVPPAPSSGADRVPPPWEAAPRAELVMTCSKGTYVRSLVRDLGAALGCGAVTGTLRRLAIGPFRADAAAAPEAVGAATPLLPLEAAVADLPRAVVPRAELARFLNGQAVRVELPAAAPDLIRAAGLAPSPELEVRAHSADGRLLAIAVLSPDGRCSPRKVLAREGAA